MEERITNPDLGLVRGLKENFVKAELKPHNSLPNLATPIFFVAVGTNLGPTLEGCRKFLVNGAWVLQVRS